MIESLLTQGQGSKFQSESSARSGDAFSGSGSVNVGGFNPPVFLGGGGGWQVQLVMIAAIAVVAVLLLARR